MNRFFWFLLFCLTCAASQAAEITVVEGESDYDIIIVVGELQFGDEKKFQALAIPRDQALVMFNSNGGNLRAGVAIGQTIKIKQFETVVPSQAICFSACALAWLGSDARIAFNDATIGFHAAYSDVSGRNEVSGAANAYVGAYLNSLGLSENAVIALTDEGPNSLRLLTPELARALRIYVEWTTNEEIAATQSEPEPAPPVLEWEPVPPAEEPEWRHLPHTDLPGGDIAGMPLSLGNWRACQNECESTSDCLAFTFNEQHNACFLKAALRRGLPYHGASSGYRSDLAGAPEMVATAPMSSMYQSRFGTEIVGRPAWRFTGVTANWCSGECADSQMCRGYSYYPDGICLFHSETSQTRTAVGVISAIKARP